MIDTKRLATDAAYWRECGAPEDATHVDSTKPDPYHWIKRDEPKWFSWSGRDWWEYRPAKGEVDRDFIPRPQSEWVDGLPPEGTECEINLYGYWFAATVMAYGKTRFIYEISPGQVDDEGDLISGELDGSLHDAKFRPIPTKAQRDRDELAKLIDDSQMALGSFWTPEKQAEIILSSYELEPKP